MHTMTRSWWGWCVGLTLAFASGGVEPAHATEPGLTAQQLIEIDDLWAKAAERRKAGDSQGAIALIQRAIEIHSAPYLVYGLARLYEDTDQYTFAQLHYRQCIGTDADDVTRRKASEALLRVDRVLANGRLVIKVTPADAIITLDDAVVTPDGRHTVLMPPGNYRLVVDKRGYAPQFGHILAEAGRLTSVTVVLVAKTTPDPTAAPPDVRKPDPFVVQPRPRSVVALPVAVANDNTAAWWLIGAGGVTLTSGVVLLLVGAADHADLEQVQAGPLTDGLVVTMTRQEALALSEEGKTLKTIGVFGTAVGLGIVAAGLIVLATSEPSTPEWVHYQIHSRRGLIALATSEPSTGPPQVHVVSGPAGAELGLGIAARF